MIPRAIITQWRQQAPWPTDAQVEQDLVLTRALIELYQDDYLREALLFRGGTALNKLFLPQSARYSEDIDLVQVTSGPIGEIIDRIRSRLDGWLGIPRRKRGQGRVTLLYRFDSEPPEAVPLKLKVEINTREHFCLLGVQTHSLSVDNRWFQGSALIPSYCIEELLATKLRALYQRKKGRDLFDFFIVFQHFDGLDEDKVVSGFQAYLEQQGLTVSQKQFLMNLELKFKDDAFINDIKPLLSGQWLNAYSAKETARELTERLLSKLP